MFDQLQAGHLMKFEMFSRIETFSQGHPSRLSLYSLMNSASGHFLRMKVASQVKNAFLLETMRHYGSSVAMCREIKSKYFGTPDDFLE